MGNTQDNKQLNITIDGMEYTVSLRLSVSDYLYFIDYLKSGKSSCEEAIATTLLKHINPKPPQSISDMASNGLILEQYINGLVDENKDLSLAYAKFQSEEKPQVRFIKAMDEITREMATNMGTALMEFADSVKLYMPDTSQITANIQKALEPIMSISKKIGEMVIGINSQLKSVFEKIKIPQITDERKAELQEACETWGTYGWTILPNADLDLFIYKPKSMEEANALVAEYCDKKSMYELFNLAKNVKGVKMADFEEAIYNFENKKYKSCAMILMSLLDAKLIRMQRNVDRNSKGKRSSGLGAIKKIESRILQEQDVDKKFLLLLSYTNLFACLKVVFADGDDFKKQPKIVNRNFIEHGMLTNKVKKRDCIQLFLLYYNFLDFFDIINS